MAEQSPQALRIFLSHSKKDDDFGVKLVEDLRRALGDEAAVWYDSLGGLHGGDTWWRTILEALQTRNIFIVVLSPNSMQSPWVNDEIDMAWRLKNSPARMRIIPVLYQPCEVRPDLGDLQIISFLPPQSYESAFKALLITLGLPVDVAISRTTNESDDPDRLATKQEKSERNSPTVSQTTESTFIKDPSRLKNVQILSRAIPPAQTATPAPNSSPGSVLPFDGNNVPRLSRGMVIFLIALILLVVAGSASFFYLRSASSGTAGNHAPTTATSTTAMTATATTGATPTAQKIAAATDAQNNPYAPHGGSLVLDDPMTSIVDSPLWVEQTGCAFNNGAYSVSTSQRETFYCPAQLTSYNDFTYQVQMTIVKGDGGGMIFRLGDNHTFYYFYLSKDGSYKFDSYDGSQFHKLTGDTSSAILAGPNQPNLVAVTAYGSTLTLYVNLQQIASVNDSAYGSGGVALAATSLLGSPTEVMFRHAKVWT
jgi:hypothetical protein